MRVLVLFFVVMILGCDSKPPDRIIMIQGKKQHILEKGKGSPSVVFVSGFGDRVSSWMAVQHTIAEETRTLSYDRAGLGESDMRGKNRSLDSVVFELNQILEHEGV